VNICIQLLQGVGSESLIGFIEKADETDGGSQAGHAAYLTTPEFGLETGVSVLLEREGVADDGEMDTGGSWMEGRR
jgi:hypothetical protein